MGNLPLFFDYVLYVLSSGAGVAFFAYIAKRYYTHVLNKEFEKFKNDLLIRQKLENEKQSHIFNEEVKCLKRLWTIICDVVEECGKFDEKKSRAILGEKHDALEEYLYKEEPFIHDTIALNALELLDLSNPEDYKPEMFDKIKLVRKAIIGEYRKRLVL